MAHGWPQATFRIGWSAFWIAALVASILASLYSAVTIVLAHLFLGERLRGARLSECHLCLLESLSLQAANAARKRRPLLFLPGQAAASAEGRPK